jgi:hypothetical protein
VHKLAVAVVVAMAAEALAVDTWVASAGVTWEVTRAALAEDPLTTLAARVSPAESTSTTREVLLSVAVVSTALAVRITRHTATGAITTAHTDVASCFLKGDVAEESRTRFRATWRGI